MTTFYDLHSQLPEDVQSNTYAGRIICAGAASGMTLERLADLLDVEPNFFSDLIAGRQRTTQRVKDAAELLETTVALGLFPTTDETIHPRIIAVVRRALSLRHERDEARTMAVAAKAEAAAYRRAFASATDQSDGAVADDDE